MSKKCSICGVEKDESEFYARTRGGLHTACKTCMSAKSRANYWLNPEEKKAKHKEWQDAHPNYGKDHKEVATARMSAWRKSHPERCAEINRNSHLVRTFGITLIHYREMESKQGGLCAICGGPPAEGDPLYVDHDHETGKIRGLLCNNCNCMLGFAKDSPQILDAAIDYLAVHGKSELTLEATS